MSRKKEQGESSGEPETIDLAELQKHENPTVVVTDEKGKESEKPAVFSEGKGNQMDIPVPVLETSAPASVEGIPDLVMTPEDAAPKKKARRGRPKGSKNKPSDGGIVGTIGTMPGPSPEDKAALAMALGMGFGMAGKIIAGQKGDHWLLAKEETELLGTAWAEALAPYMGVAGKYAPFLAAGAATVGVFYPRYELSTNRKAIPSSSEPQNGPSELENLGELIPDTRTPVEAPQGKPVVPVIPYPGAEEPAPTAPPAAKSEPKKGKGSK